MTTAAAIDRLVHHSLILERNVPSDRLEKAKRNNTQGSGLLTSYDDADS
jgi:hypothetical protein